MASSPPHVLPIPPHGGRLVERSVDPVDKAAFLDEANSLPQVAVDRRSMADIQLLGVGALSPLSGFMDRHRYAAVLSDMRLEDGLPWSIPITLPVCYDDRLRIEKADRISLIHEGRTVAIMDVTDLFQPDKVKEALAVYGVDSPAHPGVKALYERGDHYAAGPVTVIDSTLPGDSQSPIHHAIMSPRQTRQAFQARGWRTIVAFQTRNPIHRAHEYLQKFALEMVDGLLIHPLVGETKSDDLSAQTRFECYRRIIDRYYPKERVLLAGFPAAMRYAGPREAIFHAICRQNYGCTHFIVGRDHAGVGNYYGTYDAQLIFDRFEPGEILIEPIRFEHAFYCRSCQGMATAKTCPHTKEEHVFLSGTKVREALRQGLDLPPEFTRPEVAEILLNALHKEAAAAGEDLGGDR